MTRAEALSLLEAHGLRSPWFIEMNADPHNPDYWVVTGYGSPRDIATNICRLQEIQFGANRTSIGFKWDSGNEFTALSLTDCKHADHRDMHFVARDVSDDDLIWALRTVATVASGETVPQLTITFTDKRLEPYTREARLTNLQDISSGGLHEIRVFFIVGELLPHFLEFDFVRMSDGSATLSINADSVIDIYPANQ